MRQTEANNVSGTIGFPGTAAPQCGICGDERVDNPPWRAATTKIVRPTSTQNAMRVEAIRLGETCGSMSENTLPGEFVEPLEGFSWVKIALSQKNDAARWIHENRSRTGVRRSQGRKDSLDHHRLDYREARLDMLPQAVRLPT
ncbi:MAG: hypothetical protein NTV14_02520 [Coprothermobacterota bacterium]|nr:hypothetical protein [Coprothermobacterota bacterium]